MAKLQISAEPTFFAPVPIPVPGKGKVDVRFEFKHRTRDALNAWLKGREDRSDVETITDMVKSWDFDDALTPESVGLLLQSYIGAGTAIFETYLDQLVKGKSGN